MRVKIGSQRISRKSIAAVIIGIAVISALWFGLFVVSPLGHGYENIKLTVDNQTASDLVAYVDSEEVKQVDARSAQTLTLNTRTGSIFDIQLSTSEGETVYHNTLTVREIELMGYKIAIR